MASTRRDFLMRVGDAGGFGAAFVTMQSLGLMPMAASAASVPDLPADAGKGVKAVVLGGGIAGLVAAYEMGKAGFQCTLLEAQERPGGRIWTIRNGTTVEFSDGTKTERGLCDGELLQRRRRAHSFHPQNHPELLPGAGRAARSRNQQLTQLTAGQRQGFWREAGRAAAGRH